MALDMTMLSIQDATPEGRMRALRDFLRAWHDVAPTPDHGPRAPSGCPRVLAEWWRILGANPKLKGVQNEFNGAEQQVVDPFVRYVDSTVRAESAKNLWVFYVENQGTFVSGCESSGDDPRVWTKCDWPPTHSDAWQLEEEALSGYLLQAVLLEALYGADFGGAWTSIARIDFDSFSMLSPLPLKPMRVGIQFFTGPEVIVAASTADGPEVEVMFGSRVDGALAFAEGSVADPWDAGLWR